MLWCKMDCRGKRPEAEIPKTKKKLFKLSRPKIFFFDCGDILGNGN